jgi:uncharacterized membrane protein YfhO
MKGEEGMVDYIFKRDRFFLLLLVLMISISGILFFDFLTNNRLYIYYDIGGDTRQSYWPMYNYIVEAIRDGNLSSWSFRLGLGTSTFALYSFLFDPFTLIFLLFPLKYLTYGILVVAILKIIISGVLFYWYLRLFSINGYSAVITSLIWAFNGYMMLWGQHYWFASMLVLFTFIMFALELFLRGKKPYLFSISIALMGINSPYFLFMVSLFIFFYVVFHYLFQNESFSISKLFQLLVRFFVRYFIGLGASAIAFLPVAYLLLSSPRTSGTYIGFGIFNFATYMEYVSIFFRLFSNNTLGVGSHYFGSMNYYEGPMLSTSLLFILVLPQLLTMKSSMKNKILIIAASMICLALLIFPFFSMLFSAFSSYNYRWNFLIVFLMVFSIGYALQHFYDGKKLSYIGITLSSMIVVVGYFIGYKVMIAKQMVPLAFLESRYLQKWALLIGFFLTLYTVVLVLLPRFKKIMKPAILFIVCVELVMFNYKTVNQRLTVPTDDLEKKTGYFDYTNEAMSYLNTLESDFFRIDKNYISYSYNDAMFQNYHSIPSYNSLNTSSYVDFFYKMDLEMVSPNLGGGFDQRSILRDLVGVKYVLSKDNNTAFGYEKIKTVGDVQIYRNPYVLPLGFAYDSYMIQSEFEQLSPYEKEQALINAVVVNEKIDLKEYDFKNSDHILKLNIDSYTLRNSELAQSPNDGNFELFSADGDPGMMIKLPTNNKGWKVEFEVVGPGNTMGQLFWRTEKQVFQPTQSQSFTVDNTVKKISYELNAKGISEIRLDPGDMPGNYSVRNLRISQTNDDVHKSNIEKLRSNSFKVEKFEENHIEGRITVDKKKLLFFSIPYEKGWSLKVDHKTVPTERVNIGFLGPVLPKGTHTIELEYNPPLFKAGLIISLICWVIILLQGFRWKRKRIE